MAKKKRKKSKISKFLKKIIDIGMFLLVVLIITFLLSNYVIERITIKNHSMEPTLYEGDSVFIDKISYRIHEPKRFDIIVFRQKNTGDELIKRVVGLPYETVQIIDGNIIVDGERIVDIEGLDAPLYEGVAANPIRLSEGEYFVIGDNRKESIDSRYNEVGIVTSTKIYGRMFLRILPISDFKIF